MKNLNKHSLAINIISLLFLGILILLLIPFTKKTDDEVNKPDSERKIEVVDFQTCRLAGFFVDVFSFPPVCITDDGQEFILDLDEADKLLPPVLDEDGTIVDPNEDTLFYPGPVAQDGCLPAGCSQQLCVEAEMAPDIVTTCEFKAEYACYLQGAVCGRNSEGECAWLETPELKQCLNNPPPLN
jgi:hypothetical protein